jgi:AAA15 family ATPase/GTPase
MLDFAFKNYTSFKEEQHFSMLASSKKEKFPKNEDNIAEISDDLKILKTAVVYGANASGKSNFLNAFNIFKQLLFYVSVGNTYDQNNPFNKNYSFILNSTSKNAPTLFEITFIIDKVVYRYGFEFSKTGIIEEWLIRKIKREAQIFYRTDDEAEISGDFTVMKEIWKKKMVRPDTLLLTVAAQFNDPLALQIFDFFNNLNVISGIHDSTYRNFTLNLFADDEEDYQKEIIELLQLADFGIDNITAKEDAGGAISLNILREDIANYGAQRKKNSIKNLFTIRKIYDDKGAVAGHAEMKFDFFESEGTKKFFHLLGPILNTLQEGKILIIDELDTKLHPMLTKQVIHLFKNPKTNPKNAQLIFATHDINLLEAELFRRDQIWFTEKNRFGASTLFALADFKKGVRNDEKISKRYMEGRYGAVPYLAEFEEYFESQF